MWFRRAERGRRSPRDADPSAADPSTSGPLARPLDRWLSTIRGSSPGFVDNRVDATPRRAYRPASAAWRNGERRSRGAKGRPGRQPTEWRGTVEPPSLRQPSRRERRERASRRPEEGPLTRRREPLPTRLEDLPPLPDGAGRALDGGLAALGIALDTAAREAVEGHLRLLLAWTQAINLTAVRDPVAAATNHVVDSLSAVPLVRRWGAARLLDIGSGGGYPGLPLAAVVPAGALLVESVGKKVRFLETAAAATGLAGRAEDGGVEVVNARAEALAGDPGHRGRWPLVTARAVARLDELVELALPLLSVGGRLVAWKRGDLGGELAAAARASAALGGEPPAIERVAAPGLDGHVLVIVSRSGHTPDGYPRDPAVRVRRPW